MIDQAERSELQGMLAKFFAAASSESSVRAVMASDSGVDEALWRRLGDDELGVLGLHVPTEYGGAGHGFGELALVLAEAGASLACVPLLSSAVLATTALLCSGDEQACARWLPPMVAGTSRAALAVHEPGRAWQVDPAGCRATRSGDAWTLTGTKSYVLDGAGADILIVSASTPDGPSLFTVDAAGPGIERRAMPTLDLTRPMAEISFHAATSQLLGTAGSAASVLEQVLRVGCIALAAEQVGAAGHVLETATEYARTRIQFGRPIGSFQAVKHRCADMLVTVAMARGVVTHAIMAVDGLGEAADDLAVSAAMAKSYCSQALFDVAAGNIQVHGGIGFTWEHSAHLYFKRAKSTALLFGDPAAHRLALAGYLGAA
ncbi:acyl-CoA dehydrogenase family protein [Jatrophihabitans sp.]|uniref:acyl-CoA dehydrogenase family protein n=1 Tax=Jatrophihabitans sp. TaxID=1932789 RepID=UPI0030C78184|nr:acyl-CoA dehydrogenase protein [Jatrophihabitans sp.]